MGENKEMGARGLLEPFSGFRYALKVNKMTKKAILSAINYGNEGVKRLGKKTGDMIVSTGKNIRSVLDNQYFQLALDIAGLFPGIGNTADLANAMIYLTQTPPNYTFAILSLVSCLTLVGDAVGKSTKLGLTLMKTGKGAKYASSILKKSQIPLKALHNFHAETFDNLFWSIAKNCTNDEQKAQKMKDGLDAALQNIIGHTVKKGEHVKFASLEQPIVRGDKVAA